MAKPEFARFIRRFARTATAHAKKVVVARNYERLPEANVGTDVDIVVRPEDLGEWHRILGETCVALGLSYHPCRVKYLYCRKQIVSHVDGCRLEIDFLPRFVWRGVRWATSDDVIKRAIHFRERIWIPHPADECVISFCHKFLHGGTVKRKYVPTMAAHCLKYGQEVRQVLEPVFGRRDVEHILAAIQRQDFSKVLHEATTYRLRVLARGFRKDPLGFLHRAMQDIVLEISNGGYYPPHDPRKASLSSQ